MQDSIWNDVYMRKNFQDTGKIPADGGWTQSPDIIPNGLGVMENPVSTLTGNWNGPDVGKQTVLYQPNYFYVRGKNLAPSGTNAKFELYYCPSHLFLFPSLWKDNQMKTSAGQTYIQAAAEKSGDIMVPNQPFTYIPNDTEHHCLISRVITEQNPNPLPEDGDIADMNALATYIQNHPNMAWRNVELVQQDIPTFNRTFNVTTGTTQCQVMIFLECLNVKGSSVCFSCGTPIPSGPDAGKAITLTKTIVTQDSMSLGTQIFTLPANFSTTITYSYFCNPPVQKGWQVNFHAVLLINPTDRLFRTSKPLHQFGVDRSLISNGLEYGIRLGSIFTVGK
ncbi:MAG: hypothetical protein Q8920_06190 [Bacillota bacterium]|nr:hypothetical protein [Bacillota bacterium]